MSDKKSQQGVSLNKCSVPGWDELADNKIKEIETLLRSIAKCLDTRYAPWKLIIPKGKLLKAFDGIRDWAAEPTWFLVSSHDKLCAIRLKFTYRLSGRLIVHAIYPPFPRYSNETASSWPIKWCRNNRGIIVARPSRIWKRNSRLCSSNQNSVFNLKRLHQKLWAVCSRSTWLHTVKYASGFVPLKIP